MGRTDAGYGCPRDAPCLGFLELMQRPLFGKLGQFFRVSLVPSLGYVAGRRTVYPPFASWQTAGCRDQPFPFVPTVRTSLAVLTCQPARRTSHPPPWSQVAARGWPLEHHPRTHAAHHRNYVIATI